MYILAVDTATNSGGVALSRNREVIGSIMAKEPLRYSELLIPMLDFLLRQHRLQLPDVDCLAVAVGPGSFTGVRVGLAVVKAIGQVHQLPAVGVSTLEALAFGSVAGGQPIVTMIDARRQQVYGAAFRREGGQLECLVAQRVCRPEAFLRQLELDIPVFVGDGARLYQGAVESAFPGARLQQGDNRLLDPLCALAFQRFGEGKACTVSGLQANYVRPSDAELQSQLPSAGGKKT